MNECPVCDARFTKTKDVDTHLRQVHPENVTPYACLHCSLCFASKKARVCHTRNKHSDIVTHAPGNGEDEPTGDDAIMKGQPSQIEPLQKKARIDHIQADCPFVGTFLDWILTRYNVACTTQTERLSPSTITRIDGFAARLRFDNDQTLLDVLALSDDGCIIDLLDAWLDSEVQQYELQTINNHLRYLRILVLFHQDHIDTPTVQDTVVEYIVDLVTDTQKTTTRTSTTLNILKLEDPFALARIRDKVVNGLLRDQVEYINPYLLRTLRTMSRTASMTPAHLDFGVRLRNWIELAMRFTNVPCRIQCSRELQMSSLDTEGDLAYVTKLVLREGQYCRLINQDKTASTHQPLLIPLGRLLSAYLHIYLKYFRPDTRDHTFVFCTRRGNKWRRPSRDLKEYLETTLAIPIHRVDPTGRFVHGSRAIMMAVFAIGVAFDQQKMHGFARLMRHSSTTNERFYSMWQQRALSNQSIDVFAQLMNLDFQGVTIPHAAYQPVALMEPPALIMTYFLDGLHSEVSSHNVQPCYGTRSIGTQTGNGPDLDESHGACDRLDVDIAETIPPCTTCGRFVLELYGPFGSARRKKYFGRYYLACSTCHRNPEGRFMLHRCLWFPLGHTPMQKTNSNIPRNLQEIRTFIASRSNP